MPVTVEARKAEEGAARRVDDRELVRKAQRGDKGAFEELIIESVPSTPTNDDVLVSVLHPLVREAVKLLVNGVTSQIRISTQLRHWPRYCEVLFGCYLRVADKKCVVDLAVGLRGNQPKR